MGPQMGKILQRAEACELLRCMKSCKKRPFSEKKKLQAMQNDVVHTTDTLRHRQHDFPQSTGSVLQWYWTKKSRLSRMQAGNVCWKEVSSRKEVPSQKEYGYPSKLLVHWDHFLFALDFLWQGRYPCWLDSWFRHHKGGTNVLSQVISSCKVDYEGGFSSWIRRERRCQVKRNMPMQVNCWLLALQR